MCLGFVHVPDIGPVPFQITVQKFVQRCETHMEAQSCKASCKHEGKKRIWLGFKVKQIVKFLPGVSIDVLLKQALGQGKIYYLFCP